MTSNGPRKTQRISAEEIEARVRARGLGALLDAVAKEHHVESTDITGWERTRICTTARSAFVRALRSARYSWRDIAKLLDRGESAVFKRGLDDSPHAHLVLPSSAPLPAPPPPADEPTDEEIRLWDRVVAAAIGHGQAVEHATWAADALLVERRNRFGRR